MDATKGAGSAKVDSAIEKPRFTLIPVPVRAVPEWNGRVVAWARAA